jgi:hypothetical protein
MMTASSVRETRGRKAKLDDGLQQLSRVTTANKRMNFENPLVAPTIFLKQMKLLSFQFDIQSI